MVQTSPVPEDAPVMSITFPATFSMNMDFMLDRRSLKNIYIYIYIYIGRMKTNMVRTLGETVMYMIW